MKTITLTILLLICLNGKGQAKFPISSNYSDGNGASNYIDTLGYLWRKIDLHTKDSIYDKAYNEGYRDGWKNACNRCLSIIDEIYGTKSKK